MRERSKAVIVGAGPTGLAMAHELAGDGIQCRLIDKAPHRAMQSRAIAIHSRTVETFELMRLADAFLRAGHRITGVNVNGESGRIANAAFGMLDTRYPFVLGVPQDATDRILEERVARLGVRVERNTELISLAQRESSVSVRLRTAGKVEEVETDWLLGCDGAHSTVREQLGISFSGGTYPEHFVLADVKVAGDLDHAEAQVWLHQEGALAFFPLPEDRWRLIIINSPPDWHDEPGLAQCQALVKERSLDHLRLGDPRLAAGFPIHRRGAARLPKDPGIFLGGAPAISTPARGPGSKNGILAAFNFPWEPSRAF